MAISEPQRKATEKYQKDRVRFILWYPKADKRLIEREMEKKGLLPRDVFEAGLKALRLSVPEKTELPKGRKKKSS